VERGTQRSRGVLVQLDDIRVEKLSVRTSRRGAQEEEGLETSKERSGEYQLRTNKHTIWLPEVLGAILSKVLAIIGLNTSSDRL